MKEFYITDDGIRLHAKLDTPDGFTRGPLVILIHGFTGHMEEPHIIGAQQAMNEAGFAVPRCQIDDELRASSLDDFIKCGGNEPVMLAHDVRCPLRELEHLRHELHKRPRQKLTMRQYFTLGCQCRLSFSTPRCQFRTVEEA